ncbi:MAG: Arm DNA-binding domain-containing protein, partial [Candidatus Latescibacterota bacterium]|nr:Arm DNA-binding domain-containing protein [Candidatus Latescibacterota bacterium]
MKAATFDGRPFKLHDGDGLFLHVKRGGKYWRFRYWIDSKERVQALGVYPAVSLSDARAKKDQARTLLAQGLDPVAHRLE